MSRVINLNKIGTQRTRLTKSVTLAIRELMSQHSPDQKSKDLVAYIVIALEAIYETVEQSVIAWEKRGYWVKADRYRMEWIWCQSYGERLKLSLIEEKWTEIIEQCIQIADKLKNINVSPNHRLGQPWNGAYEIFEQKYIKNFE